VQRKLGLPPERFHVLPMRTPVLVAGVRVTLVDANHCPGAVQILFHLPDGKRVLHCGDMRFHEDMKQVRKGAVAERGCTHPQHCGGISPAAGGAN
jgi:L-ascorbate metabolism protein UlaG (beta-lactamase superfamily)